MVKISFKKFKSRIFATPRKIAQNVFLSFIVLFCFSLLVGIGIFFTFVVIQQGKTASNLDESYKFQMEKFNELAFWIKERENLFEKIKAKDYANPFLPKGDTPLVPTLTEGEQVKEIAEEAPVLATNKSEILKARNLFELYLLLGKPLPSLQERAKLCPEVRDNSLPYQGYYDQNQDLLDCLKAELTK